MREEEGTSLCPRFKSKQFIKILLRTSRCACCLTCSLTGNSWMGGGGDQATSMGDSQNSGSSGASSGGPPSSSSSSANNQMKPNNQMNQMMGGGGDQQGGQMGNFNQVRIKDQSCSKSGV